MGLRICEQVENRQVHVESFLVQTVARAQDLDGIQFAVNDEFQSFPNATRKAEKFYLI